jgi:hypothetical protein
LLMGAGMAVVARNEFRGRDGLRRFDVEAPALLGRNQLAFLGLIVLYCLWSMTQAVANPITDISGLEAIKEEFGDIVTQLTLLVYGLVMVMTVIFQGFIARYYFGRTRLIKDYLSSTPEWIVEIQRTTSHF